MTQPPYRRIANEIRARIADRELRPGDPVPSARGITREWGVALATATKVLATLNAEGVTRSQFAIGDPGADLVGDAAVRRLSHRSLLPPPRTSTPSGLTSTHTVYA